MSRRLVPPAETVSRQNRASDPGTSAWVSANAGSGKTWVLTQRVIRTLLSGTSADRILCLTFTKAAAANMSNRVFSALGEWATADDEALKEKIAEVEGTRPGDVPTDRLARARRLFAEAIETPGGLKIQTIHAFCESILKQFPLEADLGGGFDILDDRRTRELVQRAREGVLVAASAEGTAGPLGRALATALEAGGELGLERALTSLIGARDDLARWIREAGDLEAAIAELGRMTGLRDGRDEAGIRAEILASPNLPAADARAHAEASVAGAKTDQDQAARLFAALDETAPAADRVAAWRAVFFTKGGTPKAARSLGTKKILDARPDFLDRAAAEVARLGGLFDELAALASHRASAALLLLGDRVIQAYESAKRARSAVDFDDLVGRTADLLSIRSAAAWVQYKLDKGIDHILIDEAQDTNPRQWRIVSGLAEEFFAGEGARAKRRTIFAVGDEKQSIYSFQGAAPETFTASRRQFETAARGADEPFAGVDLVMSFRSVPAVLSAVDAVFAEPAIRAKILSDATDYTAHTALRADAPGEVAVWPMELPDAVEEPTDWTAPLDAVAATQPHVRLARAIADEIGRLTAPGFRLPGTGARVEHRHVMVLVRKRGPFVDAMNRVLKERGIPVAGQDRLKLADHIAVLDLVALGRVVAMPEDDLSLAALLKSPLVGLDDDALTELAAIGEGAGRRARSESLSDALARRAEGDPRFAAVAARIARWRDLAARLPTYEFFARVLSADGGRAAFVARLGSEADDVLDEFLAQALDADRGPAPSLSRFVEDLAADSPEIKREMDEARDEVRVMTVHGSKGLEASVVFLVDGGAPPTSATHAPPLLRLPHPVPGRHAALAWSRGKADPSAFDEAKSHARDAAENEYLRLLYVAMTRAKDRLVICGHAGARGADPGCWHSVAAAALREKAEAIPAADGREVLVWREGPTAPVAHEDEKKAETAPLAAARPAWVDRAPPTPAVPRRLTPSSVGEEEASDRRPRAADMLDAALAPESPERLRGILTHRLLEVLPNVAEAARGDVARRHVAAEGARLLPETREEIVAEVEAILADLAFAAVFAAGSRAEAPIAGEIVDAKGGLVSVAGRIDRLAVTGTEVLVVDFKSERTDAERARASEAQVAQLALYRRLLGEIFPGRRVRCAILWTAIPRLDEIETARLDAAARRLTLL